MFEVMPDDVIAKLPSSLRVGVDRIPSARFRLKDYIVCGVYFLFNGSSLRYIGQSRNILRRVDEHYNNGQGLEFDSFTFVRCPLWHLDDLEQHCIQTFKPPLNATDAPARKRPPTKAPDSFTSPLVVEMPSNDEALPLLMTIPQAIAYSGIKETKMREFIKEGKLEMVKIGAGSRIPRQSLANLLNTLLRAKPSGKE